MNSWIKSHVYTLPVYEEPTDDTTPLLLVVLVDLDESVQATLIRNLGKAGGKVRTWTPSARTLQPIAPHGYNKDSQANLYAVATLAHRAGWPSFVVADELTKRQLTGGIRMGESAIVSVVEISIQRKEKLGETGAIRVIARRTSAVAEGGDNRTRGDICQPQEFTPSKNPWVLYNEVGLVLHDPDRPIFSPDGPALESEKWLDTVHTVLSGRFNLPVEIVGYIALYAIEATDDQRTKIPNWVTHDNDNLNIMLLYPTTDAQLSELEGELQGLVSRLHEEQEGDEEDMPCVQLIPWNQNRSPTRRDLMDACDRCQNVPSSDRFCPELYFLLAPPEDLSASTRMGSLYYNRKAPGNVSWRTLPEIMHASLVWHSESDPPLQDQLPPYKVEWVESETSELLYHPSDPFYVHRRPWEMPCESLGVFHLTNDLTDDQERQIWTKLHSDTDNLFCQFWVVPWRNGDTSAPNGTLQDMWEIFWEYIQNAEDPVFFIDAQSAIDGTIIIAGIHSYFGDEGQDILQGILLPEVRGMRYDRIDADSAAYFHCQLQVANMSLSDMGGHVFPRPDWPGHGILSDDD